MRHCFVAAIKQGPLQQWGLACGALLPIRIWRGGCRALHGAKQTTLCQQDVLGGFADGPAVLPRLPVPLRFAHVLHIGEILFVRILKQFDKMRSLFSGPLNGFSENRNGSVLHSIPLISAVSSVSVVAQLPSAELRR